MLERVLEVLTGVHKRLVDLNKRVETLEDDVTLLLQENKRLMADYEKRASKDVRFQLRDTLNKVRRKRGERMVNLHPYYGDPPVVNEGGIDKYDVPLSSDTRLSDPTYFLMSYVNKPRAIKITQAKIMKMIDGDP